MSLISSGDGKAVWLPRPKMLKCLILLVLIVVFFTQTPPAYCGSRSISLIVSATLPEHVMDIGTPGIAPFLNNPNQLVQTEMVVRNNKSIRLTSIVVP